jgi:hypothetical protein
LPPELLRSLRPDELLQDPLLVDIWHLLLRHLLLLLLLQLLVPLHLLLVLELL